MMADAYWYLDDDQQNPSLDDFRQPEVGWQLINEYDQEHNGIVWLPPSQANNTFAIATTKAIAEETGIEDLHDFADYVNNGGEVKLITRIIGLMMIPTCRLLKKPIVLLLTAIPSALW